MITEAEIRRLAAHWQADPMILDLDYSLLEKRHKAYELDWERRLDYLIPDSDVVTFDEAWQSTIEVIGQVQRLVR